LSAVCPVGSRPFALEDAKTAAQFGGALALDVGKVVFPHRDHAVADHVDLGQAHGALGASAVACRQAGLRSAQQMLRTAYRTLCL